MKRMIREGQTSIAAAEPSCRTSSADAASRRFSEFVEAEKVTKLSLDSGRTRIATIAV